MIGRIGDGAFSIVGLAVREGPGASERVAIKYVPPPSSSATTGTTTTTSSSGLLAGGEVEAANRLRTEAALLQSLSHPCIIQCLGLYEDEQGGLGMVMPWCEGGDLYEWCAQQAEHDDSSDPHPSSSSSSSSSPSLVTMSLDSLTQVKRLWIHLAQAVAYLHDQGIAHRDLKLENILLTGDGLPILADFGFARRVVHPDPSSSNEDRAGGPPGSDEYAAPELVMAPSAPPPSLPARRYDARRSDVWALGVIAYALLYRRMPFVRQVGQTRRSFLFRVASAQIKLGPAPNVGPAARDLLSALLRRKGEDRPTVQHVLSHSPWVLDPSSL
ncbi:MAG: kinase-like domain-containing protein [Piptocephalis tieghemiana]|nr:MAG: kinase-like domain-containing protein [Piptocephalis tieghemiana]